MIPKEKLNELIRRAESEKIKQFAFWHENKIYHMKFDGWWFSPEILTIYECNEHSCQNHKKIQKIKAYLVKNGWNKECIETRCQRRKLVQDRQIFMYLLKRYTYYSDRQIGENCGVGRSGKGLDHATVITGLNTIRKLMEWNKQLQSKVNQYVKELDEIILKK